ncbi:hypothetical protein AMJ80_10325 [bacterium SM23_31]|nr:MAG: hypothetical protein AMJ80_10325 [bacterium SM23_31]
MSNFIVNISKLDFPEFDLKDYIPPDKHTGLGQPVINLYNGIIFKNNCFYMMLQTYSSTEKTYYRNIYKVSTSFQIERKINIQPFPSSKSQKQAVPVRYRTCYSPFDTSDDETSIYYPLRNESKVVIITGKNN